MRSDFVAFIMSYGRADRVKTVKVLEDGGYTGDWFIVIDNEDSQGDEYRRLYGDRVIMFDKSEAAKITDIMDLDEDRQSVTFVRNYCFVLAEQMGYRYFLELDDDYSSLMFRYVEGDKLTSKNVHNFDDLFEAMIDFLDVSGALTVAFAQGGDFIGGLDSENFKKKLLRKAMNTLFCDVYRPFKFFGRFDQDVNAYVYYGNRGELLFTVSDVQVIQTQTQSSAGGLTEAYLKRGTYCKAMYAVMASPQAVKVSEMGDKHKRIHHLVSWNNCTVMILNEKWKKKKAEDKK